MQEANKLNPNDPNILRSISDVEKSLQNLPSSVNNLESQDNIMNSMDDHATYQELLKTPLQDDNFDRILSNLSKRATLAEHAFLDGNYDNASRILLNVCKHIDILEEFFETDEKIDDFEAKSKSLNDFDIRCSTLSAQALMKLERFENALEQWDVVMTQNLRDVYPYLESAKCCVNLNHYGTALRKLKKAIKLDEHHKEVIDLMALVREHVSYYHDHVKECTDAIKVQKGHFQPYFERGKSNFYLGRFNLALNDLKKAQTLNSNYEEIEDLITEVEDAFDKAIEEFEREEAKAKEEAKEEQAKIEKDKEAKFKKEYIEGSKPEAEAALWNMVKKLRNIYPIEEWESDRNYDDFFINNIDNVAYFNPNRRPDEGIFTSVKGLTMDLLFKVAVKECSFVYFNGVVHDTRFLDEEDMAFRNEMESSNEELEEV